MIVRFLERHDGAPATPLRDVATDAEFRLHTSVSFDDDPAAFVVEAEHTRLDARTGVAERRVYVRRVAQPAKSG